MLAMATVLGCLACGAAQRPVLERAIEARGGPLPGLVRTSEAEVSAGFPGTWRWRTVVAPPDRYAWSVETTGEPTHYLFDGRVARAFVGSGLTSEDPSPGAAIRSHARFMGVMLLDALRAPGVTVRELPPAARPPGSAAALEVVFVDTGDRYVIGLDETGLVVSVEGPVLLPPFERQHVRAVLGDHRRVGGYLVPYRLRWTADGVPLADERTLEACALRASPPASAFAQPSALPRCP
ncbi:MAG TPA: hypothetical protein VNO26_08315 [Candidatus Limnocylindria bacterium]|nr:hypothetical protein [Candidatus Limnocylindria bacterium]